MSQQHNLSDLPDEQVLSSLFAGQVLYASLQWKFFILLKKKHEVVTAPSRVSPFRQHCRLLHTTWHLVSVFVIINYRQKYKETYSTLIDDWCISSMSTNIDFKQLGWNIMHSLPARNLTLRRWQCSLQRFAWMHLSYIQTLTWPKFLIQRCCRMKSQHALTKKSSAEDMCE